MPAEVDPRLMAFYRRPSWLRLFACIRDVRLDEKGNAVEADIGFLDRTSAGLTWRRWRVDTAIHWHPFKVWLRCTRRAGLHLVAEWRGADGAMHYGTNHPIREKGIFVLAPGSTLGFVESLWEAGSLDGPLLNEILRIRLHARHTSWHQIDELSWLSPEQEARILEWESHP